MSKWSRIVYNAFLHQNRRTCEICFFEMAAQGHHAIFKRDKNNPVVDDEINLQMVCQTCHDKFANSQGNKVRAMKHAILLHGADAVEAFILRVQESGKVATEQLQLFKVLGSELEKEKGK